MPKNRDYTGLERTPSSMAWLIGRRARVKGELDRLIKQRDSLPVKIKEARAELKALDAVIPLHEVKVDPEAIRGVRPHGKRLVEPGALTRGVLKVLRQAKGEALYTAEIALRIARDKKLDLETVKMSALMDRIRKRLVVLVKQGVVVRHHSAVTTAPGSWSLIPEAGDEDGDAT